MNSDTFGTLLVASFVAAVASAAVWIRRPDLRKGRALRVLLGASVTVLVLLVAFLALMLSTLASMPDMSEF